MNTIKVKFDLKGKTFGSGDDEASLIFIQGNEWYVANLADHGDNGEDGTQTVEIDISDFHRVGDASKKLDPTKTVSNLHARFWNSSSFTVNISSVKPTTD